MRNLIVKILKKLLSWVEPKPTSTTQGGGGPGGPVTPV